MRYLLVSDLHYGLAQFDWVEQHAGEFDAVIFGGDHLDVAGRADIGAQIALVSAFFEHLAESAVVIANSGNHDLSERLASGEKAASWMRALDPAVHTDGTSVTVGADLVSVCAWWEGPVTKQLVEDQLAGDAVRRPTEGCWMWVYHSPPDESPTSWSGTRHYGDQALNELIARHAPDVVLTGHVHESPFVDDGSWYDRIGSTLVINAGRQPGPVPTHVIIDTDAGDVEWWSIEGAGRVAL